jgi:hypothetical protein
VHVAERGIDTTLGGDSVASGREELGNTSSVESSLGETKGRTKTGTTGTYDKGIVFVVLCAKKKEQWSVGCAVGHNGICGIHTMTGYLLLTKGDASFARIGPLPKTRAAIISLSVAVRHYFVGFRHGRVVETVTSELGIVNLPTGRVVEKALACLSEN